MTDIVMIDFDSCDCLGAKSRVGIPGWSTHPKKAEVSNDGHSFNLVARFIQGEYDGQGFTAFDM